MRQIEEAAEAFKDARKEHSRAIKQAEQEIQARSSQGAVRRPNTSSITNGNSQGLSADLLVSQIEDK